MFRTSLRAVLGALLLLTTLQPTAFARTLDEILSAGTLTVGINPTLPPLGLFDEANQVDGFDAEVAAKLAEMLGVELEIVQVGSPDRIPFVASGKIDFVMGAMTRTSERAKVIDFTVPVHTEVFGVLTTSAKPYTDWRELDSPDVTLVQVRGTTPVPFIEENLPQANLILLDNYPDVVRALAQGRGDALLDVIDFVGEHMQQHDVDWKSRRDAGQRLLLLARCGQGQLHAHGLAQRGAVRSAPYRVHRRDLAQVVRHRHDLSGRSDPLLLGPTSRPVTIITRGETTMRLLALVPMALLVATAAPEARTLDEVLQAGVVRVGVNPGLPPRALYDDKNEIAGFEPDVAAAIAAKLGVELELVQVGSPDRIPFVATDKVDFVMGAMSRTSERAKVIDYTVPLHSENYGIVTTEDSGIDGLEDLDSEDVTLVQVRGTTAIPFLQANAPKANLLLLDNYNDRDRALAQGRADASFDGIDAVAYRLRLFPERVWKIIPSPEWGVTYSALGVQKGNYSLRDWLNVALFELHKDGTIGDAWAKWFLAPMASDVPVSPYF